MKRMHADWLQRVMGQWSTKESADALGVSQRTVYNWIGRRSVPADGILLISQRLKLDPIKALIATGYWPESKQELADIPDIQMRPTEELVDELSRRSDRTTKAVLHSLFDVRGEKGDDFE